MMAAWLADAVVLLHLAFIVFAMLGGLLVLRWPRLAWLHLPAAAWGVVVEWSGWICPLTPLENALRQRAGLQAYGGDFIQHYVLQLIYPDDLTREIQLVLGALVLALNMAVYFALYRRVRRRRTDART
ncbi:membrane protein [Burkholderiaceae bacterium 16]|nr:membrane protein [Burkholderiaceae bacterium 16]